tara:strand:+ start:43807 stop:44427 length:621 start_codon:yes stop_codon:yes gene_type:complete
MKQKWYISTLIIILTLIGVVCEQQVSLPNQEIVLQFTDARVSTEDAQNTLELVKKQLQDLGVENIKVKEQATGSIKITYYSDDDVALIKQILSKEHSLSLDYVPFSQEESDSRLPSKEIPITYNLDVHEIQKSHDAHWNLNGTLVLDVKQKTNHFFSPNVYASFSELEAKDKEAVSKVAFKVNKHIAIAINSIPHSIPEVRAGPIC